VSPESPSGARTAFEALAEPLRAGDTPLGDVRLLPWDADTFGFPVADLRLAPSELPAASGAVLARTLEDWSRREGVELVGCRVPPADAPSIRRLQDAGFRFVELQLRATRVHLSAAQLERPRLTLRQAAAGDRDRLADIAYRAFHFGRYHADPGFPRDLASRRYRHWIERALSDPSPETRVGVVGPPGAPAGFVHTELEKELGDIRLFASDPDAALLAGPALLLGALLDLAQRGATRVTAQISAANAAALNLYASLRFQFHDPEAVFHWTRPGEALHGGRESGEGQQK
jgi:GNAT superfamily N-acetyltransferase